MLDLIIKNARVLDGTGGPGRNADIGVNGDRISAIGKLSEPARRTIDAGGRVAAPGFVDAHTHYDAQVFWDPSLSPSCYHGVTSIIGGHCGFSIAPLSEDAAPYLLNMLARVEGMPVASLKEGVPWNWTSFGEYLSRFEGRIGLNAGFMAGHCAIRRVVMGTRAVGQTANAEELESMTALLRRSLKEGALGFSSTQSNSHNDGDGEPVPSRHATRDEMIALAAVCREQPGTSLEFLPGTGKFSDAQIDLMADMSIAARRVLNWNVLNVSSDKLVENQLSASDCAARKGGRVVALAGPVPATARINLYSGFIFDMLAGWSDIFKMSVRERIEYLSSPEHRRALDQSAKSRESGFVRPLSNWETFTVTASGNKDAEGKTVGEIARRQDKSPIDAMLDLAIADNLKTVFLIPTFGGDDESWKKRGALWTDPRTCIGASDAGAHLDMIDTFAFTTAVLGEGVRRRGLLALEQAVHQLTQIPAEMMGLVDRGVLKEGNFADIVVFDPDRVDAGPIYLRNDVPANEMRLYSDAAGIDHVIVNGVGIVDNGVHTAALPGKVLRSGVDTYTPSLKPN